MTMDARKQRVLQAIVALYGLEGEPVGSSVLANYFDMAVSSATLRNEMAALTKLGLLEQPHTSAGRVPSAKGYRYYLDNLLTDDQPLDRVTRARVEAVFASLDHEPEKLAQGAAKALAAISGCTAAVSTPCAEDLCVAHYEVVQVGRSAAAVLAVTTAGYVRTRVARVRTGLSRENAAALAALLNRNLTFVAKCLNYLRALQVRMRVHNEVGDLQRRVVSENIRSLELCDPQHLFAGEIEKLVRDCMAEMPELTRQVFTARRIHGKSYREIAAECGITERRVETELEKALGKLREVLRDYLPLVLAAGVLERILR